MNMQVSEARAVRVHIKRDYQRAKTAKKKTQKESIN